MAEISVETDEEKPSKWRQIIVAGSVNLSIFSCGVNMGWPSPVISKFQNPTENPLPVQVTPDEEAWMGSLILIAAVFGPFYSGIATKYFGRKMVLLSSVFPIIIGCIWITFAKAVWHIYIGRILWGLAFGQLITCVPMYVGEIADKHIRGALGTFLEISLSLGFLFSYSVGPNTSYFIFNLICAIPPIAFLITFSFMPESPSYLVARGDDKKAFDILLWLYNGSDANAQEKMNILKEEFVEKKQENIGYFESMRKKGNIKALYLGVGLYFFQQFSGINVVQFYLQTIFEKANTGISAVLSAVLVGILQTVSACITPFVVDRWGRRILLMISALGMSISLGSLGLYFILDAYKNPAVNYLGWLPVTSLITFVIMFCLGFGPVVWALLGELFDSSVKEINITLISSFASIAGFITAKYFSLVEIELGTYVAFWIFASSSLLAFFFIYFFLPETKGKSLQEIQVILNK